MKTKVIILSLISMLFVFSSVNAQWRIGVTAGATYNHYSIDTRYMNGINYTNAWGGTFGVLAQYDIFHWLGVRTDLNLTFKSHKVEIPQTGTDYKVHNGYIQLPIMASFSTSYKKIRVFCNLGMYGAYWASTQKDGMEDVGNGTFDDKWLTYDFSSARDQRFDYGLVGGAGIEWKFKLFKRNWSWQIVEARIYYSTQSTQKHYMKADDPRYNTTFVLQSGLCYLF
ncbi:MAG: PorT family protein [Bacteroides sp.]|nr:PorT family protein [Bacteroides sp.]